MVELLNQRIKRTRTEIDMVTIEVEEEYRIGTVIAEIRAVPSTLQQTGLIILASCMTIKRGSVATYLKIFLASREK